MRFFTHNIWWKLLSIAMAFGIWINIAGEPDLETIIPAPVEYKNYPRDLEISSNIVEKIDVETHGPAGQLRDLSASRLAAVVDFANVTAPGERTYTVTGKELKLPRGITLVRTIPAQLQFRFERRKTRSLKVDVRFSGALRPGLSIASYDVNPPDLSIAGPESRVDAARTAVADPFDLNRVTEDSTQTLAVYVAEPEVRFLSTPQVKVKIHVDHTH